VVIDRGQVWWAEVAAPGAPTPARRPVLVVQSDAFNRSRLPTVVAVLLTSNTRLVQAPGNVLVPARVSKLARDAVANVSQIVTIDRDCLKQPAGRLRGAILRDVENGLRLVLGD
jgi:mRNA interferase MazF